MSVDRQLIKDLMHAYARHDAAVEAMDEEAIERESLQVLQCRIALHEHLFPPPAAVQAGLSPYDP